MRLFIVAALFLVFSTACASPVHIAARGARLSVMREPQFSDPFHKLSDEDFETMFQGSQPVVFATFDKLVRVRYKGVNYQILALVGKRVDDRNLHKDGSRFLKKDILLGVREVDELSGVQYFIFPDNTFSGEAPKEPMPNSVWEDAGISYDRAIWDNMKPENKRLDQFIYMYNAEKKLEMAIYMRGLYRRDLTNEDPPSYPFKNGGKAVPSRYNPIYVPGARKYLAGQDPLTHP